MNINFERLATRVADAVEAHGYELVDNISRAIDDLGATVGEKPVVNITVPKDINPEKIAEEVAKVMKNFVKAPQAQPAEDESWKMRDEVWKKGQKPDEWEEILDFFRDKEKAQPAKERLAEWEEELLAEHAAQPAPVAEKAGSNEHLLSILSSINTYLRAQGYYKEENVFAAWLADDFHTYVRTKVRGEEGFRPGPFS